MKINAYWRPSWNRTAIVIVFYFSASISTPRKPSAFLAAGGFTPSATLLISSLFSNYSHSSL